MRKGRSHLKAHHRLAAAAQAAEQRRVAAELALLEACAWCERRCPHHADVWGISIDGPPPGAGHVIIRVPVGDRTLHAHELKPERGRSRIAFLGCSPACLDAIEAALAVEAAGATARAERRVITKAVPVVPFASLPPDARQAVADQLLSKCTWCLRPISPAAVPVECWYRVDDDLDPGKLGWQSLTLGARVLYGRVERDLSYEGRTGTFTRLLVCSVECGEELKAEVRRFVDLSCVH